MPYLVFRHIASAATVCSLELKEGGKVKMPWPALIIAGPPATHFDDPQTQAAVDERLISGRAGQRRVTHNAHAPYGRPTADQQRTGHYGRWWSGVVGGDFSQTGW